MICSGAWPKRLQKLASKSYGAHRVEQRLWLRRVRGELGKPFGSLHFIASLYRELFDEECKWHVGETMASQGLCRISPCHENISLATTVWFQQSSVPIYLTKGFTFLTGFCALLVFACVARNILDSFITSSWPYENCHLPHLRAGGNFFSHRVPRPNYRLPASMAPEFPE
jgi:hypothetical protein